MVFFSDAGNRVVDMNDSGFEMLGYCREETSTLQLADIFLNPDEIDTFITRLSRDGYIKDLNVDLARRDGKIVSVLLSATAIIGERGEVQGSEVIAKDLTRLKTMMEQLASSEKMASVGQIAAGVAHEINTPLGIILGYSQLLMDDVQEDSDAYQSLKVIERQTKASRKIVADLLKFSRQSGSTREEVDLNEILADVVAVTEHTLGLSNIAIHRQMANDLPGVDGDPENCGRSSSTWSTTPTTRCWLRAEASCCCGPGLTMAM